MFTRFGLTELLIILAVVVLLFGVGRISKVAGEFGKGIRSFKNGLKGEEDKETPESESDEKTPRSKTEKKKE